MTGSNVWSGRVRVSVRSFGNSIRVTASGSFRWMIIVISGLYIHGRVMFNFI